MRLVHTTLNGNIAGDGSAIFLYDQMGDPPALAMTNTVLVNHTVGISASAGTTVTAAGILWFQTLTQTTGAGAISVSVPFIGDPRFAADG